MEVKRFSGTVDLRPTEGKFKARICTFGVVDKGGDVVRRGAFDASLSDLRAKNAPIPVIFNHQDQDLSNWIGEVNPHDCQETEKGLVVSGQLDLDKARGQEVYQKLRRGMLREWSFTAWVKLARPRGAGRELVTLELKEVGPTLVGKGETETLMVASADDTAAMLAITAEQRLVPYRLRLALVTRPRPRA